MTERKPLTVQQKTEILKKLNEKLEALMAQRKNKN